MAKAPNVQANRVANYDACRSPGDFFLTGPNPHDGGMRQLKFICPCGVCGDLCAIRIRDDGQNEGGAWGWDRNEEKPTTTPSIRINGNHWHGYLKAGVFEACE